MSKKYKQGIVLITTMLTVVLVIMLLSSVVYSNFGNMRLTSNFYGREEAIMAAQSGVEYAITKLQNDITWQGNDENYRLALSVKVVKVIENSGNVWGMLTTPNGRRSFFRIKFNYEDGPDGFDNMDDTPNSNFIIRSPYVSVNNLYSRGMRTVYMAPLNGILRTQKYKDEYQRDCVKVAGNARSYELSKSTCALIVEGFSGIGVRNFDLDKMGELQSNLDYSKGLGHNIVHNIVEVYLTFDPKTACTSSVLGAGGKISAKASNITIKNAQGNTAPRLRALKDLSLTYKNISFDEGQAIISGSFYRNGAEVKAGNVSDSNYSVIKISDKDTDDIARIKWNDVTKAYSEGQKYTTIKGGFYIWRKNDRNNTYTLTRYDKNPFDKKRKFQHKRNKSEEVNGYGSAFQVDKTKATITISENIKVEDGKSLTIVYDDSCSKVTRPVVAFVKNSPTDSDPILSADGDIIIKGATLGSGSITSEKSISLQGPSILESDPGVGVSVYAKRNVNFLPIESATQTIQEQNKHVDFTAGRQAYYGYDTDNSSFTSGVNELLQQVQKNGDTASITDQEAEAYLEYYLYTNYKPTPPNGEKLAAVTNPGLNPTKTTALQKALDNSKAVPGNYIEAAVRHYQTPESWTVYYQTSAANINPTDKIVVNSRVGIKKAQTFLDTDVISNNFRDYKQQQLNKLLTRYGKLRYSDQDISGMVYAWGNINLAIGQNSTLNLSGAMIAYGQDPDKGAPQGDKDHGNINIEANTIGLTLDADYMNAFIASNAKRKLKYTMYSNF